MISRAHTLHTSSSAAVRLWACTRASARVMWRTVARTQSARMRDLRVATRARVRRLQCKDHSQFYNQEVNMASVPGVKPGSKMAQQPYTAPKDKDANNNMEQEEADAFNDALDSFVADVTSLEVVDARSTDIQAKELNVALAWFREAIYYNLPHGKRNRGLAVVMTHKILSEHYKQRSDLRRARIIGWCIEMLQTHFLILDDIMDESLTRRGQKCWHLKKNVGNIAINDSFFMQQSIFYILKKHFSDCAYYTDLITLLFDTMLRTTVGQCLDLNSSAKPGEVPDLDKFTLDKYYAIIDHKTAFYSFSAPIRLGMILSNLIDPYIHQQADVILRRMGQFFQVQDDYLDCFGDPMVMGKIGTDIEEGKCCWPIVTALSLASPAQRAILEQNYARKDKHNTESIKQVYRELNLEAIYKQYELDTVFELRGLIDKFSRDAHIPGDIFYFMLLKICGRQK